MSAQMSLDLTAQDLRDFSDAENAILALLNDGRFHSASEIIAVARQREALRRLRNLRSKGYQIEKKRFGTSRDWSYRMVR